MYSITRRSRHAGSVRLRSNPNAFAGDCRVSRRMASAERDYVTPLVSTPLRREQYHAYHVALEPNPLAGVEASLKRSRIPVRIVWGAADDIFAQQDADYLDRTFQNSRGIRRVPEAKLFFQEEFPDVIAEEAQRLWREG